MRAAVYKGSGRPWVVEELPNPEPGPGELVIKVHRCGICGTDLHLTSGHPMDFPAGSVLGHEYAGEVVKRLVQNGQPVEYGQPLFAIRPRS